MRRSASRGGRGRRASGRRRASRGRRRWGCASQQRSQRVFLAAIEDLSRFVFVVPIDVDAALGRAIGLGGATGLDLRRRCGLVVRSARLGRRWWRRSRRGQRRRRRRERNRCHQRGRPHTERGRRRRRRRRTRRRGRRRRTSSARNGRRRRGTTDRGTGCGQTEQSLLPRHRRRRRHSRAGRGRDAGDTREWPGLLGGEPVEDIQVRTGLIAHRSLLSTVIHRPSLASTKMLEPKIAAQNCVRLILSRPPGMRCGRNCYEFRPHRIT